MWFAGAVQVQYMGAAQRPTDYTCYTGEPRYCSEDVWYLRGWACAVGGFNTMSLRLQRRLLKLEYADDGNFCFARSGFYSGGILRWIHVDHLHPGGDLPSAGDWRILSGEHFKGNCRDDRVDRMATSVRKLLREASIKYCHGLSVSKRVF